MKDRVVSCNISRKTVTLASGEEISYDFLVFACGSSVPFPGKRNSGHVRLCALGSLQLGSDLPEHKITLKFWHRLNEVDWFFKGINCVGYVHDCTGQVTATENEMCLESREKSGNN